MNEAVPPMGKVTALKGASATVVPLVPEPTAADAVPQEPALSAASAAPTSTPAPMQAVVAGPELRQKLTSWLQRMTTHTLPVTWYRIARVGPAGLVGGAAILAAITIFTLAMVTERHAADALSARLAHVQTHPGELVTPDAGAGRVLTALPRRQEMPAVLGLVLEQARAANVGLDNGHYTYSVPKGGNGIARYELEFPVKASYPNVRDFINRTLSAVPAAGLDKLRIERKAVGDSLVSADIRFVVFVRAEQQP